ncbi:7-methylguanosine phosphate-specific 5'-nucleotidase [Atheta coriaria]|uniref:7-methylguanosine phosphate-specific 5'-nucleotidase n=1 Tax=Dalotia coriaria TaxID=877792 RepID=UPI0031F45BB7
MHRDYVRELGLDKPFSSTSRCHIKDAQRVNALIAQLVRGGCPRLLVVSDFDRTITKQHENGKTHVSSFGIFARCKSLPPTYMDDDRRLTEKYLPIEVNPAIPFPEKKALMEEWWNLSEKLLVGLSVSDADLEEVVTEVSMSLRDNAIEMFQHLQKNDIPLLVFSAGIGDVVVAVLMHFNVLMPNVKVVSNFLKRNDDGKIEGFNGKMINVFNKNQLALVGTSYYPVIADRTNVIVIGDSIGDAGMAEGLSNSDAILKIGFLYDHAAANLPAYQEHFDIVLEDDQSMNVLLNILKLIESDQPLNTQNNRASADQPTDASSVATK